MEDSQRIQTKEKKIRILKLLIEIEKGTLTINLQSNLSLKNPDLEG